MMTLLPRLCLCALLATAALARDDSPRSIKETLNKHVVIVRSTRGEGDSSLRLQMVRSSDSKLFIKYRYSDSDDDDEDYRLQFSLRLDHLIEYEENGDDDDGYQPDEDRLVQTVSFKGTTFSDWVGTTDSNGARAYYTSNGVFGFTAHVSERSYNADDHDHTRIMPDEVKFDVAIESFPWLSQGESHVAVVAMVQSSMRISRDGDERRIAMDGSDGYITWDNHCVFNHTDDNCTIALSAIYDDNTHEDDEGNDSDNVKALVFSFVDDGGSHPSSLMWDPVMGSDPSAASNGASAFSLLPMVTAFAVVFALLQ